MTKKKNSGIPGLKGMRGGIYTGFRAFYREKAVKTLPGIQNSPLILDGDEGKY
jgi:hypothetical protein